MFVLDTSQARVNSSGSPPRVLGTGPKNDFQGQASTGDGGNFSLALDLDEFIPANSTNSDISNNSNILALTSQINDAFNALLQRPDITLEVLRRAASLSLVWDQFVDELIRRLESHHSEDQAREDISILAVISDPTQAIPFLQSLLSDSRLSNGTKSLIQSLISLCESSAIDMAKAEAKHGKNDTVSALASLHLDNPDVNAAINDAQTTSNNVGRDQLARNESRNKNDVHDITTA